jgi:hypothetical protein
MPRPIGVSLLVFLTLLVDRTVCDSSSERSVHDDVLASLCTPNSPTERTDAKSLPTPTLSLSDAYTLQISIVASAEPLALFVTDANGFVVALDAQRRSNATLTLLHDDVARSQRLVPRALFAEGCTTVEGMGVDNWQAVVEQFDYEAATGLHLEDHAAPSTVTALSEPELASAEPQLEVTADGRTIVRMLQLPSLYVPLVYLRGCHNMLCEAVVYVRRFTRSEWPTAADGARTFMDATSAVAGWWGDPACTSLFVCAAMPPVHHHGGLPQRCTEVDVRPAIVARLEAAAAAAATRPTSSDTTPLRVDVSMSGATLRVRAAACDEMRLYLKDGMGSGAAVLAFRAGPELTLKLAPSRDATGNTTAGTANAAAPSAPRVVWAHRACGPVAAPAEHRCSAPIELAPLLLAANAAHSAASPTATVPGALMGHGRHDNGHDDRRSAAPPSHHHHAGHAALRRRRA